MALPFQPVSGIGRKPSPAHRFWLSRLHAIYFARAPIHSQRVAYDFEDGRHRPAGAGRLAVLPASQPIRPVRPHQHEHAGRFFDPHFGAWTHRQSALFHSRRATPSCPCFLVAFTSAIQLACHFSRVFGQHTALLRTGAGTMGQHCRQHHHSCPASPCHSVSHRFFQLLRFRHHSQGAGYYGLRTRLIRHHRAVGGRGCIPIPFIVERAGAMG